MGAATPSGASSGVAAPAATTSAPTAPPAPTPSAATPGGTSADGAAVGAAEQVGVTATADSASGGTAGGDDAAAQRQGPPTPTTSAEPASRNQSVAAPAANPARDTPSDAETGVQGTPAPGAGETAESEPTVDPRPTRAASAAPSASRPAFDPSSGQAPARAADPSVAAESASSPARQPVAPMMQEQLVQAELRRLGSSTTRLGLDIPTEQLGTIRVDAIDRGGDLQLNLSSDRSATRHLLTNELSSLRSELADGASVHVDVGERGRHPSRSATGAGDRADGAVDPANADVPTTPAEPSSVPDQGRLDLRL